MADVYTRIGYIKGDTGATGAQGAKGDTGDAATIAVGTVTTVPYGQTANVVNSGTSGAAVFDFTIPQGKPGEQTTDMQNLTLGSITTSSASFPVPAVGETGKVLWGKVVKWFSDMSALVASKFDASNVVNNLTTTAAGYALDARQGNILAFSLASRRAEGTYTGSIEGAYGFVTSQATTLWLYLPFVWQATVTSVTISKLLISLRVGAGGYLLTDGADITSYITNINVQKAQGILMIRATKSDGFGVTNNSIVIGRITEMTYVVS